jgi:small-conductance mechanosensitive channel
MRSSRSPQPRPWRAGAVLVPCLIVGYSGTATLMAAAGISMLVVVMTVAVVAVGASFGRSPDRRRACLRALETLLRLAPWTDRR